MSKIFSYLSYHDPCDRALCHIGIMRHIELNEYFNADNKVAQEKISELSKQLIALAQYSLLKQLDENAIDKDQVQDIKRELEKLGEESDITEHLQPIMEKLNTLEENAKQLQLLNEEIGDSKLNHDKHDLMNFINKHCDSQFTIPEISAISISRKNEEEGIRMINGSIGITILPISGYSDNEKYTGQPLEAGCQLFDKWSSKIIAIYTLVGGYDTHLIGEFLQEEFADHLSNHQGQSCILHKISQEIASKEEASKKAHPINPRIAEINRKMDVITKVTPPFLGQQKISDIIHTVKSLETIRDEHGLLSSIASNVSETNPRSSGGPSADDNQIDVEPGPDEILHSIAINPDISTEQTRSCSMKASKPYNYKGAFLSVALGIACDAALLAVALIKFADLAKTKLGVAVLAASCVAIPMVCLAISTIIDYCRNKPPTQSDGVSVQGHGFRSI